MLRIFWSPNLCRGNDDDHWRVTHQMLFTDQVIEVFVIGVGMAQRCWSKSASTKRLKNDIGLRVRGVNSALLTVCISNLEPSWQKNHAKEPFNLGRYSPVKNIIC